MFSITRKKVAVAGTLAVLGVGSIVAYAYWTSSGTGVGSASTTTAASTVQILPMSTNNGMAPVVAALAITGTIQNTNASGGQNAFVHQITVTVSGVTETSAELAANTGYTCSAVDYTITGSPMTVDQDLTPGQTVSFSGASIAFNDLSGVDQDACQGASVALAYASN
jgi:hypothetical protein